MQKGVEDNKVKLLPRRRTGDLVNEKVNKDSFSLWAGSQNFGSKDLNDMGPCSFHQNS